jgi:hypothetical protein
MQCASAILPSVAYPYLYFSTLSHKRHDFRKEVIEHKMCVWSISTTFVWSIFLLRRIERDMTRNIYWSHVKYRRFFSDFNDTRIFSTVFRKILKYLISKKIKSVQWELSSMRTDGRTGMTKLIVALRNCAYAPKKAGYGNVDGIHLALDKDQ